ncbi:MAG: hypoxanthine phosphoribosyltransferase [Anaerolineales bacterium]|nr:hypoxanthine phosphoribosyltransferase [Anaerolineales bacterium]
MNTDKHKGLSMHQLPPELTQIIIDTDVIQKRVHDLAAQISKDYADVDQLHVVGILKGAFIFMADLCRQLTIPHLVDFMALSSYGKRASSTGAVRIVMDLRENIETKDVLIVEDILDTGQTLNYLMQTLSSRKPASLRTCVFLRKRPYKSPMSLDYLGFEIPDVWVVGYGLDYAEIYRTLPYVAELNKKAIDAKGG